MCLQKNYNCGRTKRKTKENCIFHALKRFKERFNKEYTSSDIDKINSIIIKQKTEHIIRSTRQSLTRTIYELKYNDDVYFCVYNKTLKTIVTVLENEWIYEN